MAYCTDDDVFTLGLAAQAFVVRPRPVPAADVDGATGAIRLKAHGLTEDDVVVFEVTSGGSLPTGITAFTPYYPAVVTFDLFKLSATKGGAPLTFASVGSGWAVAIDPLRRIGKHREAEAAAIDQHLPAHATPIKPDPVTGKYPPFLVALNARMTARAAVTSLQVENPAYRVAIDRLFAQEEFDQRMLADFARGWALHPKPTDQTTTPDNGARASSSRKPVGWTTGTL